MKSRCRWWREEKSIFRSTRLRATTWATLVAPIAGYVVSLYPYNQAGVTFIGYVLFGLLTMVVAVPFTLIGLTTLGYALTYLGEKMGNGSRFVIATIHGLVAAVGIYMASIAEWPNIDEQVEVWLTLTFASIIFSFVYLQGERPMASAMANGTE